MEYATTERGYLGCDLRGSEIGRADSNHCRRRIVAIRQEAAILTVPLFARVYDSGMGDNDFQNGASDACADIAAD